jgi:hypothetical protein
MMNDQELQAAIDALPGEKVTEQYMRSRIVSTDFFRVDDTVTVCSVRLDNGYSVRGESACVDPANYNEELGQSLAFKQAIGKLWPLFDFLLSETRYRRAMQRGKEMAGG